MGEKENGVVWNGKTYWSMQGASPYLCRSGSPLAASRTILLPPGSSAQHSQRRFRFIFANDVHYRGDKDAVMLTKVLNEWKTDVPQWEFAVVAGDLTNHGDITKMKSLKDHLDNMDKPYYPIIGNHDITAHGRCGKEEL